MQAPASAGEVIFQIFDAISFSLAYFIGAAILLSVSDPRLLLIPLLGWFALYGWLVALDCHACRASLESRIRRAFPSDRAGWWMPTRTFTQSRCSRTMKKNSIMRKKRSKTRGGRFS